MLSITPHYCSPHYTPLRCQGTLLAVNEWGMDGSIMLGKCLGQVERSGLNCARKIQLGFMDTSVLKSLSPTQCLKMYNQVWFAQVGEQYTSMSSHKWCVSRFSQVDQGRKVVHVRLRPCAESTSPVLKSTIKPLFDSLFWIYWPKSWSM